MVPLPSDLKPWLRFLGIFTVNFIIALPRNTTLNFTQDNFDQFVENISLPKLTSSDLEKRNAPITTEEFAKIVKDLPPHESPGPDGLPYHNYKSSCPLWHRICWSYLEHCSAGKSHTHSSHISAIPKPGKNPSLPDNCSPGRSAVGSSILLLL